MSKRVSNERADSLLVQMAKLCGEDTERWLADFNGKYSIPHHALELMGDAGMFAGIVQKIECGELDIKDAKVRYELALKLTEVFMDVLNLSNLLQVDLEYTFKVVRANVEKAFSERNGNGGR